MTVHNDHINYRTVADDRPTVAGGGTTSTVTAPAGQPKTPNQRRAPRWVAPVGIAIGAALVVGAGVLLVDAVTEPSTPAVTDSGRSQRLVQESIDQALAERAAVQSPSTGTPPQLTNAAVAEALTEQATQGGLPAHLQDFEARVEAGSSSQRLVQNSIDEALAQNRPVTPTGTSQQLVQNSIDEALAQNRPFTPIVFQGTSERLVRESIREALAANASPVSDGSFEHAEANRMAALG